MLQPHESSSETRPDPRRASHSRSFNLTRVRLKREIPIRAYRNVHGFNLTRVRLKQSKWPSILVSLSTLQPHESSSETGRRMLTAPRSRSLQPHESSSETRVSPIENRSHLLLQPHESSSETCRLSPRVGPKRGFNLTRVRLKL